MTADPKLPALLDWAGRRNWWVFRFNGWLVRTLKRWDEWVGCHHD